MRHFGSAAAEAKGGLDLVTEADLASERLILSMLQEHFPGHQVVAEETAGESTAAEAAKSDFTWYVDPLDGTANFSRGDTHFAVSLGLVYRGNPYIGVVFNPARDHLFTAICQDTGHEGTDYARFNNEVIRPQSAESLQTASVATDWPWDEKLRKSTLRILSMGAGLRQMKIRGCAALDLCDVARGVLDAYLHPCCRPWDRAIIKRCGNTQKAILPFLCN